jgi:acetylglutamate kinase
MRVLVKIGGAQLERPAARAALARAIRAAQAAGHELVLVHGGGDQIRRLSDRLGVVAAYREGLRITDGPTAEIVLQVLGGEVNRTLVRSLQEQGVPAVGLTGADGGTFSVKKHEPDGVDLGFVGEVETVRPALVEHLLAGGWLPVIATVAPRTGDADGPFHNVNADMGAGPLTRALGADALLFLTDTDGVLDAERNTLPELTPADCAALERSGVISAGMIPKVRAALAALGECPAAHVAIVPAAGDDAITAGLAARRGTRFRLAADGAQRAPAPLPRAAAGRAHETPREAHAGDRSDG